ncbi:hypothetical protein J4447_00485 [Candidatus Pacearchaeota archaeon]|nr:hypothetical protein [Candidatus Pacearchaeota archaeon]
MSIVTKDIRKEIEAYSRISSPDFMMEAAREFATRICPIRGVLQIEDLMLFGSVAKKRNSPADLDLLVIHNNPIFDRFKELGLRRDVEDLQKYATLAGWLNQSGVDLFQVLRGSRAEQLITWGIFNLSYLNKKFFTSQEYREWIRQFNKNPDFEANIFSYGLLWNPQTARYDLSAHSRYIISSENRAA